MGSRREAWAFIVAVLASLLLFSIVSFFSCALVEAEGVEVVSLDVFVVCLDGVDVSGVVNMSRVLDGVLEAADVEVVRYWTGEWESLGLASSPVMNEVSINVSVTVISDWTAYKILLEYASNIIVVNAHGETLPIPTGYDGEGWVGKIAEAMLVRGVSWIHAGEFPFRYYWLQDRGLEEEWHEQGFEQFMLYLGENVVIYPIEGGEAESLNQAILYVLQDWPAKNEAAFAKHYYYLKSESLTDNEVMAIYGGTGNSYFPSSIFGFSNESGFYIHLGITRTYRSDEKTLTDSDFCKGYLGTAATVWINTMKHASKNAILNAELKVAAARAEGRVEGIEEAVDLLNDAKEAYASYHFGDGESSAINLARKAAQIAERAVKQGIEVYWLPITLLFIISRISIVGFAIRRRNSKPRNAGENACHITCASCFYSENIISVSSNR